MKKKRARSPSLTLESEEEDLADKENVAAELPSKRAKTVMQATIIRSGLPLSNNFHTPNRSSASSLVGSLITPESTPRLTPHSLSANSSGAGTALGSMSMSTSSHLGLSMPGSRDMTPFSSRQVSPLHAAVGGGGMLPPKRHLRMTSSLDTVDLSVIMGPSPRAGMQPAAGHSSAFQQVPYGQSHGLGHTDFASSFPGGSPAAMNFHSGLSPTHATPGAFSPSAGAAKMVANFPQQAYGQPLHTSAAASHAVAAQPRHFAFSFGSSGGGGGVQMPSQAPHMMSPHQRRRSTIMLPPMAIPYHPQFHLHSQAVGAAQSFAPQQPFSSSTTAAAAASFSAPSTPSSERN